MKISLEKTGKRFNYNWIFRNLDYEFSPEHSYVILGANGSGKSTLLQVIAGNILPSQGAVNYHFESENIDTSHLYRYLSFASPYLELLEEFTIDEQLSFHFQFKSAIDELSNKDIKELIGIKDNGNQLRFFSSGMKQRIKLCLAILSDTPLLLLDEPTSNLDKSGVAWYQGLIEEYKKDRVVIVCSNQQEQEYMFCTKEIRIEDYKL